MVAGKIKYINEIITYLRLSHKTYITDRKWTYERISANLQACCRRHTTESI